MNVSICGIEHEIIECEDTFGTDTHMGEIEYGKCLIRINKNISTQLKKATLCHEILHGMLLHIGRDDLSQDEQFVTALGNAISHTFNVKGGFYV